MDGCDWKCPECGAESKTTDWYNSFDLFEDDEYEWFDCDCGRKYVVHKTDSGYEVLTGMYWDW